MSANKYCPDPDSCTYSDCPTAFCDRNAEHSLAPAQCSAAFPIMEGGARRSKDDLTSIPWAMIAPHDATAQRNHGGQNLIRLAQRGGLCPLEAVAVLEDAHYRKRWPDSFHDRASIEKATLEARAILKQMVANWTPPNDGR